MFIIQCDKCKIHSEPDQRQYHMPDGWREIVYSVKQYATIRKYHLCPKCTKLLGLPEDQKESLADQFIDILNELAVDAVEDTIANLHS